MDTMTYVVVAGWVLMYFTPAFPVAVLIATGMAFLAVLLTQLGQGDGLSMAGFMALSVPLAPITFFAVFMAWPLGIFFRRLRGWWRRKAAGV